MLLDFIRNGSHISFEYLMISFLSVMLVMFVSLPVHEFAHAFVAHKCGDDTAKYQGRLTLNPLKHLDPMGTLMIFLIGFGYAKPVPVNYYNFNKPKRDSILVSLAGPMSNFLLAFLSMGILKIVTVVASPSSVAVSYVTLFLYMFIVSNISLMIFNLLPIPPLDGSHILSGLLPVKASRFFEQYAGIFQIALYVLMFTGALSYPISMLSDVVYKLLYHIFF